MQHWSHEIIKLSLIQYVASDYGAYKNGSFWLYKRAVLDEDIMLSVKKLFQYFRSWI